MNVWCNNFRSCYRIYEICMGIKTNNGNVNSCADSCSDISLDELHSWIHHIFEKNRLTLLQTAFPNPQQQRRSFFMLIIFVFIKYINGQVNNQHEHEKTPANEICHRWPVSISHLYVNKCTICRELGSGWKLDVIFFLQFYFRYAWKTNAKDNKKAVGEHRP